MAERDTNDKNDIVKEYFDRQAAEIAAEQRARAGGQRKNLRTRTRMTLAAFALVSGMAGGCAKPEPTPTPHPQPVPTSGIQPIVYEPTATPETPVERVVLQDQSNVTVINADIIVGLSIGGEEKLPTLVPEGGGEGIVLPRPLEELVRLNWGKDFMGKGGPQTSVQALEAYISATGPVAASEGIRIGAAIDLAKTYPGLKGPEQDNHLWFFCGQIMIGRGWEEVLTEAIPPGATLKNEVGIEVVGRHRQGLEEAQVVLGFNDWVYVGADGQLVSREWPRISFAIITEKDLPRLLQMINPAITYQDGVIAFPGTTRDGRQVIFELFINTFSPESYDEVVREAGLEYISTAEVPVVPYPPDELMKLLPEGSQYSHTNAVRGYFAPGPGGVLGKKAILTVEYDGETIKGWVWKEVKEEVVAPQIEGLKAMKEGDKIIYRAEAGNKYGLKENELAGKVISIKVAKGVEFKRVSEVEGKEQVGLVLHPSVVKDLFLKANTPEMLAKGEWKIPLPFELGMEGKIFEVMSLYGIIGVSGLANGRVVSPYPELTLAGDYRKNYAGQELKEVGLLVGDMYSPEDVNWGPNIYYASGKVSVDNFGRRVNFGETLISNIEGLLPSPPFLPNLQIAITMGSLNGPRNIKIENILSVENCPVSMMVSSQ